MKKIAILFVMALAFAACEPHEYYALVNGTWEGTDWTRVGSDANLAENNTVLFIFNEDKSYEATLGASQQKGTFKFTDEFLQFFPEGLSEIRTSVIKLDNAYLQLRMDNNGVEEILTLRKKE